MLLSSYPPCFQLPSLVIDQRPSSLSKRHPLPLSHLFFLSPFVLFPYTPSIVLSNPPGVTRPLSSHPSPVPSPIRYHWVLERQFLPVSTLRITSILDEPTNVGTPSLTFTRACAVGVNAWIYRSRQNPKLHRRFHANKLNSPQTATP